MQALGSGVTTKMVQVGSSFTGHTLLVIEQLHTRAQSTAGDHHRSTHALIPAIAWECRRAGQRGPFKDGDMQPTDRAHHCLLEGFTRISESV